MANILLTLLLANQAATAPVVGSAGSDPLSVFSGEWQIVDTESGKVTTDCSKAQIFQVSPDRKTVSLTQKPARDWTLRYLVLRPEEKRVLMFIENENRTTRAGDPILWWAYFDGPDRFRWRRYDWKPSQFTPAHWQRCPTS